MISFFVLQVDLADFALMEHFGFDYLHEAMETLEPRFTRMLQIYNKVCW
jgi:hypothetical protein